MKGNFKEQWMNLKASMKRKLKTNAGREMVFERKEMRDLRIPYRVSMLGGCEKVLDGGSEKIKCPGTILFMHGEMEGQITE